jgi:acyl-CoA synthetase (AMP-forming)/AMP-acid ligase II
MTGAKLVFPGPAMDGKSIFELIETEKVSFAAGVPTVWQMMLGHMQAGGLRFSTLKRTVIGGSACPPAMITAFNDQYGVEVLHAWGMTEMSPLGTVCTLKNKHMELEPQDKMKVRLKQGRGIFGVDMKIVDPEGQELPWDGKAFGDLLVRGPWIISAYFKGEGGSPLVDGNPAYHPYVSWPMTDPADVPAFVEKMSAAGVQTAFQEAKLQLRVRPHVTADGSVSMHVRINRDEPDFNNTGARGDPTILRREAETDLLIQDGRTAVIGGIYSRTTGRNVEGLPLLGDIPILGVLFSRRRQSDRRSELLIFITPRIVNRAESLGR